MMAMFVVIKQSVFDQELSDTRFVQVAALAVVVELKDKNYQDSPPCQVFSPGAGSAPTTVYQNFLALHHHHHWDLETCNYAAPVNTPDIPSASHLKLQPLLAGLPAHDILGPDFISSSLTVIFPN